MTFWGPKNGNFGNPEFSFPRKIWKTMSKNFESSLAHQKSPMWVKRGVQKQRNHHFWEPAPGFEDCFWNPISKTSFQHLFSILETSFQHIYHHNGDILPASVSYIGDFLPVSISYIGHILPAHQKSPMWVKRGVQKQRKSSFLGASSKIWGLFLKSISKHSFWTTFSGKGSQVLLQGIFISGKTMNRKSKIQFLLHFLFPLGGPCWWCA